MARRPEPLMRSQLVRAFLARVPDPAALVARCGLPPDAATAPEVVLPLGAFLAFGDAAAEAARDPWLGLHTGAALDRGTYGLAEYACRSAPTVREAVRRLVRYVSLLNELVVVELEETDGTATVSQRVPGHPLCVGRQANELFVAMLLGQARQLTGAPLVPERVFFAHPPPADRRELVAFVGSERIEFGAGRNGFALAAAAMDARLSSADAPLLSLLDRQAERSLTERSAPSRFLGGVKETVRERLAQGVPPLEEVAAALRMSPRTLQRRLAAEGTSWQKLVEAVREEVARARVADPAVPLGEIAYLCGYSELSAFLRAFKRWTGKTPAAFR